MTRGHLNQEIKTRAVVAFFVRFHASWSVSVVWDKHADVTDLWPEVYLITSEQLFSGVTVSASLLTERLTHRPSNLHSAWPQMTGCFLQIVSKRLQCGSAGADSGYGFVYVLKPETWQGLWSLTPANTKIKTPKCKSLLSALIPFFCFFFIQVWFKVQEEQFNTLQAEGSMGLDYPIRNRAAYGFFYLS